jgi:hypothetical protein
MALAQDVGQTQDSQYQYEHDGSKNEERPGRVHGNCFIVDLYDPVSIADLLFLYVHAALAPLRMPTIKQKTTMGELAVD